MITLLIVDDEPASRKVIKAFLPFEQLGISAVLEASNGKEAMDLICSGTQPQIIITDMEMPVVGGIQFLDYLSDCHPEIKVIVVSGYFDFRYTHVAITSGVRDYILKPIDPQKLHTAVQTCVDQLQQEEANPSVTVEGSSVLDVQTYRAVLNCAEQMRRLLECGDFGQVQRVLASLQALIQHSDYPDTACQFSVHLFGNVLRYYCVSHNYLPTDEGGDVITLSKLQSYSDLAALYEETVHCIQEQSQAAHIDTTLEKIKAYIDTNFYCQLRLEEIAAAFFVNKEYMGTVFHRKYGVTMSTYILKCKMEEAIRLLRRPELSISSVAQMVGYDDPAYFNRVFKKYTGFSPGQYRESGK